MNASPLPRVRGTCWAMFAYDIGLSIDLDRAEAIVAGSVDLSSQREAIRHSRRAPQYFQFRPPPLRVTKQAEVISVGAWKTTATADFVLYDFGAVCVSYAIEIDCPLDELRLLSEALYDNSSLLADSRRRVEELAAGVSGAIGRPHLATVVEDYAVYHLGRMTRADSPEAAEPGSDDGAAFIQRHAGVLAQILRAERQSLSAQEVQDALSSRISYGTADVSLIDWNAAILFMEDAEDARCVLEFANVELLEMRHLDDQLDDALDRSYKAVSNLEVVRGGFLNLLTRPMRAELRRVAELEMDNSLLFESVNNALKLLGDQYLSRLYRLAAARLHLPDWDSSILRKLRTLESIYAKLNDLHSARRMELLEWVVIILIATEIVLSLIRH